MSGEGEGTLAGGTGGKGEGEGAGGPGASGAGAGGEGSGASGAQGSGGTGAAGAGDAGAAGAGGGDGAGAGGGEGATGDGSGSEGQSGATVPEKYEFRLPEGVQLSDDLIGKVSPVFRELGLSQTQAQKLVDLQFELNGSAEAARVAQAEAWAGEVKKDKELGGDNFDATVGLVRRVVNRFGDDGVREVLNVSGLGNHPALVRFISKIGAALSEDTLAAGAGAGESGEGDDDAALRDMYPTMFTQE